MDMAKTDTELYQELQQQKKEEYERTTGEKLEKDPVISNTEYKRWLDSYSDRDKANKVLKLI